MDILIPIVFPDYLISTPAGKIPQLGHAGILLILGSSGTTRYYEYGRYDKAQLGLVRRVIIPNVVIDRNTKKPTRPSLEKTLRYISQKAGQNGRITGAYIAVSGGYSKAIQYVESRRRTNLNSHRPSYELLTNSCLHFVKSTIESAGASTPWLVDPRPVSYIQEIQSEYPDLDYKPSDNQVILGD